MKAAVSAVIVITFFSFSPVLKAGFIRGFDDGHYVTENPDITSLSAATLKKVFTSSYVAEYVPLTMVSYAVDYHFFGLDPKAFHRTNLILHLLNCLLVFWFILLLSRNDLIAAFLTSLFFGIHPLHVESVAWIAERKDVLYSLFYLGSLIAYVRFKDSGAKGYYYGALALFVLSLLSKPMAMTLPFILLLVDYFRDGKFTPGQIRDKAVFFAGAAATVVLTLFTHAGEKSLDTTSGYLVNAFVAAHGIVFYLWKLFAPVNLSFLYPFPESGLTLPYLISPLLVLALAVIVHRFARRDRVVVFGSLFFIAVLFPVLQFVTTGMISAADRYTYISYIGPFFILFTLFSRAVRPLPPGNPLVGLARAKPAAMLCLVSVVAASSFLTRDRSSAWLSPLSLWQHTTKSGQSSLTCNQLGVMLELEQEHGKAVECYTTAVKTAPARRQPMIRFNRALSLLSMGEYERTIDDITASLNDNHLSPAYAHYLRALAYDGLDRYDEAFADYAKMYELLPAHPLPKGYRNASLEGFRNLSQRSSPLRDVYNDIGASYASKKLYGKAAAYFKRALSLDPSSTKTHYNLGNLSSDQGKFAQAVKHYSRAIALDPRNYMAYNNRAVAYYSLKDYARAWNDITKVQQLGSTVNQAFLEELSTRYGKGKK